jgi:hypothetical protein
LRLAYAVADFSDPRLAETTDQEASVATKAAKAAAYEAGRVSTRIVWPDDATDEQQTPGEHHCPFGLEAPEERAEWLRGLADELEEPKLDRAATVQRLREHIKIADKTARAKS